MADAYAENRVSPLTPHIVVSNAAAAIEFYKNAFDAQELVRHPAPDGKRVMHCALTINGSMLMLCDDFPEYNGGKSNTPESLSGSPVTLHLQVSDADAAFQKAVEAGAKVTMPLANMFWGDRYGRLRDPFGHDWSIGAAIRQVTQEEVEKAIQAHAQ